MSKTIAKKGPSLGQPIDVKNEKELSEILSANNIVLVDFWAQWCGPCLLMDKNIIDIAREEMDNVIVVKVDVSLHSTLSKHFGVKGLPTVIVFKDGKETIRQSGSLTKNRLTNLLK